MGPSQINFSLSFMVMSVKKSALTNYFVCSDDVLVF